jgi:TonB-dependent SusC/RagA subfamily outer membrane receptor
MTMKTPGVLIAMLLCLATAAYAQHPIFIINGVRVPACGGATGGGLLVADTMFMRLADIDPSLIENVEIVKGAAAAREYGPDGANGVIAITTKKGSIVSPIACGRAPGAKGTTAAPAVDPVATYLYAPEFVMAHQEAIALTDRERTGIQDAVREIQSKQVVDAQLKLASAGEKLTRALARPSVDEASVLQQVDEMLALEREVKRAQMTLLVRIKNLLTPAQQALLDKLR